MVENHKEDTTEEKEGFEVEAINEVQSVDVSTNHRGLVLAIHANTRPRGKAFELYICNKEAFLIAQNILYALSQQRHQSLYEVVDNISGMVYDFRADGIPSHQDEIVKILNEISSHLDILVHSASD